MGRVLLQVGVEQEEGDPADPDPPDADLDGLGADRRLDPERLPVEVDQPYRHLVGKILDVDLRLLAVGRDPLPAEAPAIEEADADQRQVQVTGRLQVVAGQDAEAPGVDGQRLRQPELEREVADHQWRPGVVERRPVLVVLVDRRPGDLQCPLEVGAGGGGLHPLFAEQDQHRDRVVAGPRSSGG